MLRHTRRLDGTTRALATTASLAMLLTIPTAALGQDDATVEPSLGPFHDVPTYRVDAARRHVMPGAAPREEPGVVWSAKLGDEIHFNPIVFDGRVYVGDYDGVMHAIDPATGETVWTYQAPAAIDHAGDAAEGTVVFFDLNGSWHAVNAATGEPRWSVEGEVGAQAISDGLVWVTMGGGTLQAFDLLTGEPGPTRKLPGDALSLTLVDGVAYFGTEDGQVGALSLQDDQLLWPPVRLLSNLPSSMAVSEGLLFASSRQPPGEPVGELLAIDAATGEVRWRFRSPDGRQVVPGAIRDGVLYVATESGGLYAFDAQTGQVRWHVDAPGSGTPVSLAGDVLLVVGLTGQVIAHDAENGAELWHVPLGGSANSGTAVSGGLIFQADDRGNLWAFGDSRLAGESRGAAIASGVAVEPFELLATWDTSTIPGLDHPVGGDFGPDGLFWFVNAGTSEVIALDPEGAVVQRWGGKGTREGEFDFLRDRTDPFSAIGGVAVSPDGSTIYVADTVNRRVQRFSPDGAFVGQFGSYGSGPGQFLEGYDLDVGPDGSVYVVDDVRNDIQRFSADGMYLQTIGRPGSGDGEMDYTGSVVLADDGTLYNADWGNDRVQAWDADGEFLWSVGTRGSDAGEFRLPADVGVDGEGRWFATDFENFRVQAFSPDNAYLGAWSSPGTTELDSVYPVSVSPDSVLYVMNPFSDRIYVLRFTG